MNRPVASYGLLSSDDYRKLADHLATSQRVMGAGNE